jgi:hypothetical protein
MSASVCGGGVFVMIDWSFDAFHRATSLLITSLGHRSRGLGLSNRVITSDPFVILIPTGIENGDVFH